MKSQKPDAKQIATTAKEFVSKTDGYASSGAIGLMKTLVNVLVPIAAISALVYFGYVLGTSIGAAKFDTAKSDLNIKNNDLKDTIRRLKSHLEFVDINKANWMAVNSSNIRFNTTSNMPTLTVSTTSNPCIIGNVNGCWRMEAEVFKDDTLSIQIIYKNEGKLPISNVTLGFNYHLIADERKIIFRGGISSGNRVVEWGASSVYFSPNSKLELKFMPNATFWYRDRMLYEKLRAKVKKGDNYIDVGTVKPNESGVVIFNFSVEKEN